MSPSDAQRPASPALSAPLRAGWNAIAASLPAEVVTTEEMLAYRAESATRGNTAAAVADAAGLAHDEPMDGVTRFTSAEFPARMRVLFVHGGGLIAGDRFDGVDVITRHAPALAIETWSVDYPLVPEHSFSEIVARVMDVLRAVPRDLPIVVAGQSAGGGIAAAVACAARDEGISLAGQMLICPMLDAAATVSAEQFASDPAWSRASNVAAWSAAMPGATGRPGGYVPADYVADLAGLAPAFLDVGTAELFRDSVMGYAERLWAAGVSAELHAWSGAFHASDCVVEGARVSKAAHAARADWLERAVRAEL